MLALGDLFVDFTAHFDQPCQLLLHFFALGALRHELLLQGVELLRWQLGYARLALH